MRKFNKKYIQNFVHSIINSFRLLFEKYKKYIIASIIILIVLISYIINVTLNKDQYNTILRTDENDKILVSVSGEVMEDVLIELDDEIYYFELLTKYVRLKDSADLRDFDLLSKTTDSINIVIPRCDLKCKVLINYLNKYDDIIYLCAKYESSSDITFYIYSIDRGARYEDIKDKIDLSFLDSKIDIDIFTEDYYLSYDGIKKICINEATEDELTQLSGIGKAIAKRIIEYRELHGDFECIEDITNVSGIGETIFNNIKDYICVK